jgi:hypothetical protein
VPFFVVLEGTVSGRSSERLRRRADYRTRPHNFTGEMSMMAVPLANSACHALPRRRLASARLGYARLRADIVSLGFLLAVRLRANVDGGLATRAIVHEPALNELLRLFPPDATALRDERIEVARRLGRIHERS